MTWGQKKGGIYLSPWNHDHDQLVHKGHTQLNMFAVLSEQIKRLSSNQSQSRGLCPVTARNIFELIK